MTLLQFSSHSSFVRHWRRCCGIMMTKSAGRREFIGLMRRRQVKWRRDVFTGVSCSHGGNCDGGFDSGEGTGFSRDDELPETPQSSPSPYQILGVDPSCSFSQLKAAFRQKVKEFHPDVCRDMKEPDQMIKRVIQAYELLSKRHHRDDNDRTSLDPFDHPECEACDIFVNEILCTGKGCPYPCVERAPHAFSYAPESSTARTSSQGHGDDYQVMLAVGQCPRRCIHYVTPSQRVVLEELLRSILDSPYDPAEIAFLESLIIKATFENNRYQKPKTEPKASTEFVDWY